MSKKLKIVDTAPEPLTLDRVAALALEAAMACDYAKVDAGIVAPNGQHLHVSLTIFEPSVHEGEDGE